MEKEALLNIIINDLKEVDMLMNTFKNTSSIDIEFLQLSMVKISQITIEMKMLEKFINIKTEETPKIEVVLAPVIEVNPEPIVEIIKPIEAPKAEATLPIVEIIPEPIVEVIAEAPIIETIIEPAKVEKSIPVFEIDETSQIVEVEEVQKEQIIFIVEEKTVVPEVVNEVASEPIITKEVTEKATHPKEEKHLLKDVLATNKKSVNEIISEKKTTPTSLGQQIVVPVSNIYKAIGINDKLLFQRVLFANNGAKMNSTIDQLNEMKSYDEALTFLKSSYEWDLEDDKVMSFLSIVKRRYS